MKFSSNVFINELQKLAEESQLQQGTVVEEEHLPTIEKIKASIKDGKITMSNKEIYKSIAYDHLHETENPDRNKYYTLLKKYVDKSDDLKKTAELAFKNELEKISFSLFKKKVQESDIKFPDKLKKIKKALYDIKKIDKNPFDQKMIDLAGKGINSLIPNPNRVIIND